jgi:hypothetical protein
LSPRTCSLFSPRTRSLFIPRTSFLLRVTNSIIYNRKKQRNLNIWRDAVL